MNIFSATEEKFRSGRKQTLDWAGWGGRRSATRSHIDFMPCPGAVSKGKVSKKRGDVACFVVLGDHCSRIVL